MKTYADSGASLLFVVSSSAVGRFDGVAVKNSTGIRFDGARRDSSSGSVGIANLSSDDTEMDALKTGTSADRGTGPSVSSARLRPRRCSAARLARRHPACVNGYRATFYTRGGDPNRASN
ncbi:hypothetical protein EVAR_37930_1 [Eumeta japonica]|uniref:Uncharacterized protein n=1 Tax=Eumeta variegata TaxID=151549 RepID=A0A4C1XGH2_EUMVA|nr:hypothetical protein EVAR_37930_1 [Eumeta japonica]